MVNIFLENLYGNFETYFLKIFMETFRKKLYNLLYVTLGNETIWIVSSWREGDSHEFANELGICERD